MMKHLLTLALLAFAAPAFAQDMHGADDHAHHDDKHAGPLVQLGAQKVLGLDIVAAHYGTVAPGAETVFVLKPSGGEQPKALRAWVGVESGKGSVKTKADQEQPGEWHAHHEVTRAPIPGAKLWVEVETAAGKRTVSFALAPPATAPATQPGQ